MTENGLRRGVLGEFARRHDPRSRRGRRYALEVLTAAGQELQVVLGQRGVCEGEMVSAAVALLQGIPLEGKVVTADAGLLDRPVVEAILTGKGDYLGVVKENQPGLKKAVDDWMEPHLSPLGRERPPDEVQWDKGHGRVECRELWLVDARQMTVCVDEEFDWPGLQLCGRVRRSRRSLEATEWEEQETHTWVSSLSPERVTAKDIAEVLRGH